jgi:hypothetical protein
VTLLKFGTRRSGLRSSIAVDSSDLNGKDVGLGCSRHIQPDARFGFQLSEPGMGHKHGLSQMTNGHRAEIAVASDADLVNPFVDCFRRGGGGGRGQGVRNANHSWPW